MATEPTKEKIEATRHKGYRPDVVLCVLHDNKILFMYKKEHELWQIPQGGIEETETPHDALQRELGEEFGETLAKSYSGDHAYIGEDFITFHPKVIEEKGRFLDEAQTIQMVGKHYYLYALSVASGEHSVEESEFDDSKWLSFDEAKELAASIYQAKKRQLTLNTLSALKLKGLID